MKSTLESRRAGLRKLCLLLLTHELGGRGTAREVAECVGKDMKHIWPRFTELADSQQIRDTGARIHGKGRPQVVWAVVGVTHPANDAAAIREDLPLGVDLENAARAAVEHAELNLLNDADCVRNSEPDWFKGFGN